MLLKYYRDQGLGPTFFFPFIGERFFKHRNLSRQGDALAHHKNIMKNDQNNQAFGVNRGSDVLLYINSPKLRNELINSRARFYKLEYESKPIFLPLFGSVIMKKIYLKYV